MVSYVEACGNHMHYAPPYDYKRVYLRPATFLEYCPPLCILDIEEDLYIKTLAAQIIDGQPLDPPELGFRHHDGRHRASAAVVAGVEWIPVRVEAGLAEYLIEIETALTSIPEPRAPS